MNFKNAMTGTFGCAIVSCTLFLAACGDDSSSGSANNGDETAEDFMFTLEELEEMGIGIYESADEVKKKTCSDENEFETAYIKADSSFYVCYKDEWGNGFSIEPDILESKDDLGECNEENEGEMFRVPRDTIFDTYACEDGEWISDFGGNSGEPVDPATVVKGTFTDERDGKTYKTVQIGKQTWMAENLNYETSGSRCYDKKNANCEKYGRLYTHAVAQNACPNGWKLPTGKQWAKLLNIDVSLFNLVGMFKHFSSNINTNDDPYGFNVLPGGIYDGGEYRGIGRTTAFWANEVKRITTSDGLRVYMVYFVRFSPNQVTLASRDESDYFSVRCIKK
jgi:uncharacterized protein (TIGR02145 family)